MPLLICLAEDRGQVPEWGGSECELHNPFLGASDIGQPGTPALKAQVTFSLSTSWCPFLHL